MSIDTDSLVEQIIKKTKLSKPPLQVLKICEAEGVKVKVGEAENDTSGYAVYNAKEKIIYVNEKDNKLRQRFTICHELGHYFLHFKPNPGEFKENFKKDSTYFRNDLSSTGEDTFEKEANNFAARILVPETWLLSEIKRLDLKIDQLENEDIISLADIFKVSVQTMAIRIGNS